MELTRLGRTGLKVSRICLGTMNFGPQTEEPDAHRIMDHAVEGGINFFDSANVYGWGPNKGRTESIIGNWLAQGGGRRDKIVLATKVRRLSPFYNIEERVAVLKAAQKKKTAPKKK